MFLRFSLFLILMTAAFEAQADTCLPDWDVPLKVVGVNSDDFLNVRSGAGTSNEILFVLDPDERQVIFSGDVGNRSTSCIQLCKEASADRDLEAKVSTECKDTGRTWYLVSNFDGQEGWASAKYLEPYFKRNNPSFDCRKSSTSVENAICNFNTLAGLDSHLASLYREKLDHAATSEGVRRAQRDWLRARDSCTNIQCIYSSYQTRISELDPNSQKSISASTPDRVTTFGSPPVDAEKSAEFLKPFIKHFSNMPIGAKFEDYISSDLRFHLVTFDKIYPILSDYYCWKSPNCKFSQALSRQSLKKFQIVERLLNGQIADAEFDYDVFSGSDDLGTFVEIRPRTIRRNVVFSCVYPKSSNGYSTGASDSCMIHVPSSGELIMNARLSNWNSVDRTPNQLSTNSVFPNDVLVVQGVVVSIRKYRNGYLTGNFQNSSLSIFLEDFEDNSQVTKTGGPYFFDTQSLDEERIRAKNIEDFKGLVRTREILRLCYETRSGYLVKYLSERQYNQSVELFSKLAKTNKLGDSTKLQLETEIVSEIAQESWFLVPEQYSEETKGMCGLAQLSFQFGQN